jgi:hypothetical protein
MLTALSKAEGLRCAASFVIAAYCKYASFLSREVSIGFARLEFGAFYFAIEF